jgi:hypothetical protein
VGVNAGSASSVASLAEDYLDAVSRGEGVRAAVRSAFSVLVERRDEKIARYRFLENTFDVALAFRNAGSWTIRTDGTSKTVPAER